MEFKDRRDLLKNSILGDLPPEEIDKLARTVPIRTFGPGEVIFETGDSPDGLYIICSGRVRIFLRLENHRERELSVWGPGDYFGEVSLMSGNPRTASAQSLEQTTLIMLDRKNFDRITSDHPDFSKRFVREVLKLLAEERGMLKQDSDAAINYSNVRWFDFVLLFGLSIIMAITFNLSNPNGIPFFPGRPDPVPSVSPAVVIKELGHTHPLIVDAMPSNFFGQKHIKGAVNMPLAIFNFVYLMRFANKPKNTPIVVYGNTISRPYALEVADRLLARGYANVKVLKGGLAAWEASGYPVGKGALQ